MKRRKFLTTAGVTTAAAAAVTIAGTLSAPAISQDKRKWRMVTTWPKNLPGLGTGAQYFADQVTKCSDGRLTVQLFASGEVVPAFESIDAVKAGSVELRPRRALLLEGQGAGQPVRQQHSLRPDRPGVQRLVLLRRRRGQLCDEVYEDLGCKFILCGNTGVQHPGWSRKEVKTLADFEGLKIRMPGIGGEVMSRLGATVVNLPGSEVAAALASGTIDWVEWNNPYGEASMGFWRHAKFYYTPGWHEPATSLELFVNLEAWNGLAGRSSRRSSSSARRRPT